MEPTIWNVGYDCALRLRIPKNMLLVAYADILALVVKQDVEVAGNTETALNMITKWLRARA